MNWLVAGVAFVLGALFSIVIMCLCFAASESSRQEDSMYSKQQDYQEQRHK